MAMDPDTLLETNNAFSDNKGYKTRTTYCATDGRARVVELLATVEENVFLKAAKVGSGIVMQQPFHDGNTRTGVMATYGVLAEAKIGCGWLPYQLYAKLQNFKAVSPDGGVQKLATWLHRHNFRLAEPTERLAKLQEACLTLGSLVASFHAPRDRREYKIGFDTPQKYSQYVSYMKHRQL